MFESLLWRELRNFNFDSPVWVESESKRIGNCVVPDRLFDAMKEAPRVDLIVPLEERVRHTIEDYDYFVRDPASLKASLSTLSSRVVPTERMDKWNRLIDDGRWNEFVESMLIEHYDPTYGNSQAKNSVGCRSRKTLVVDRLDSEYVENDVLPLLLSDA